MLAKMIQGLIDQAISRLFWYGTVTGVAPGTGLPYVQRLGESAPDTQPYPKLHSYSAPIAGDEVIVLRFAKGNIVLGHIHFD